MTDNGGIERDADGWRVPALRGSGVAEIVLRSDSLSLHLGSHGIDLMSLADLTTDRGTYWVQAKPQTNLGVFMGLMQQVVTHVHVSEAGRLAVDFGGGWRLSVNRIDGSAGWRLMVRGVGIFSVSGQGDLVVPRGL